ncbi:ferritin-like domain-containing protein [Hansschlegelia sp.]|uniref:YciE/YciF ferroxidase family protein n=1 Tax=Hansschlegelia sp. TaxID=2041892 RepID=UPI002BD693E3|nr:DUF892 family protein [Hansschlegelia sp.]HVI28627.1 DUF892 family protein [Hansschlegelia sp.]
MNYDDVAERLRQHHRETEVQIERLETILDSLGESHSSLKDVALSMSGNLAALGHSIAGDEILKNTFANFAFENFEAASYRSLIAMAEAGSFTNALEPLKATLGGRARDGVLGRKQDSRDHHEVPRALGGWREG